MPAAMPCKIPIKSSGDPPQHWETEYEIRLYCWSRRKHETQARSSLITAKGLNSVERHSLVHKIIPMLLAMKIPDAKAAVEKELEKLEKTPAWKQMEVISKKEVFDEARTSGAKVHFPSLIDICHLNNAELEAKHQKYKGRVVLRGDIVKDNSGSYAVFTEQRIISISNDIRQNHGYHLQIAGLRWTSSRRSIG